MAPNAGCAAKLGPGTLARILGGLPKPHDENLLVGLETGDDACVYKISDELAVVSTVDFFPPIVDDPFTYGQIAAANALSDVYAMGGEPRFALNLLCAAANLPEQAIHEILRGGAEKAAEAGACITGGHSIDDPVPKYGLCVTGFVNPKKLWKNAGARPGDSLILTKPLGSGVMTTALKFGEITEEQFAPAAKIMARLNKYARDIAVESGFKINACTDVTGFGLLGHAAEMAEASGATLEIFSDEVPLQPLALGLAEREIMPGGAYRNRDYLGARAAFAESVPQALRNVFWDPQTSGGLLFALPEEDAERLLALLQENYPEARIIGRVTQKEKASVKIL
jgi:selenide,water dikinase